MQVMLSAHSRISIPPETRFVLRAHRDRAKWGDLQDPENRRALAHWIVGEGTGTRFADLGLDANTVVREIVNGPPTLGSALGTVLRAYASRFGKPRWGDKYPLYTDHVPSLLQLFPNAQFVNLFRDGRDVVASLKRMPWFHGGSVGAIHRWAYSVDAARRWRRKLGCETWHDVTYERLVVDPGGELERLCCFLGEDFDEAMLRPSVLATEVVPQWKTWHLRVHDDVDPTRVGAWTDGLEPWELGLMEAVNGRRLERLGYALSERGQRPGATLLAQYAVNALRREYRVRSATARAAVRPHRGIAARLT